MAQRAKVILVDDLDGGAAEETVSFSLDGVSYELDLSKKNARKLRDELAPYIGSARNVSGRRRGGGWFGGGWSTDASSIRQWARDQGLKVSDRGRLPGDLLARFEAARGSGRSTDTSAIRQWARDEGRKVSDRGRVPAGGMADSLGLQAVQAAALTEGIRFLYGQAGETLRRWRKRKAATTEPLVAEPVSVQLPPAAFEGQLQRPQLDFTVVGRLEGELRELRAEVADYANKIVMVDPDDVQLIETVEGLRRAMEAVYGQRIAFKGEPSHDLDSRRRTRGANADEVLSYVAGMRAKRIATGSVTGRVETESVGPGGMVVGLDVGAAVSGPSRIAPHPAFARYVNTTILDEAGNPVLRSMPLRADEEFFVEVDIGRLRPNSAVKNPRRFPDWLLPEEDVTIDVVIASTHFLVSAAGKARRHTARARLVLPADGGRALTPAGVPRVRFRLHSPKVAGLARARISLYFRDAVVQSFRLDAFVGNMASKLRVITDFTTTRDLISLQDISPRQRLSFVLNDSAAGNHQIVLRAPGVGLTDRPRLRAFNLPREAIAKGLVSLRRALASEAVAPTTFRRSRQQLINDLRLLAPIGWRLNAALEAMAGQALQKREDAIVHVCRTSTSTLTLPWNLLYDIYLDSETALHPERLRICPLLGDWDGKTPLIVGAPRSCPRHADHTENMLCPFGFWGFRQQIEVLSSAEQPQTVLHMPAGSAVAIAKSSLLDQRKVHEHARAILKIFEAAGHRVVIKEATSKVDVRKLIEPDLPVIYFYCHGHRGADGVYLAIGRDESITPEDVTGWIVQRWRNAHVAMWDNPRPLVIINACESMDVSPETLLTYLDVLIGRAGAAGVIGTEVKVHQVLAMQFAETFLRHFLGPPAGTTAENAMHASRCNFLAVGNLFGLVYTTYCWADLVVESISG